ncbi:N-6 DNA methylase [Clostridium paraputrificum]|uniref:N-6 DNA methylase n=1 Tax=Clostridium paraputrificum TaxID=29363 RepID=UPI00232C9AA5|nr:N-6 DNA methylase [Clostridium paraputrificum]MDB2102352.1 N-6 DNA methylase [Clostridium paraputrificum]
MNNEINNVQYNIMELCLEVHMLSKNDVIKLIEKVGFELIDGEVEKWSKVYYEHENYLITVNLNGKTQDEWTIDWGKDIERDRATTSTFHQDETLVVLECIDRLLVKGYKPKNLKLESKAKLGHKFKGFVDILVKNDDDESYLMIECKTWREKYEKELQQMKKDGGQLFSYFSKEPKTKFLCLYASYIDNNEVSYENAIVAVQPEFIGKNDKEIYACWDKTFETKGVFEEEINPFEVKFTSIKRCDIAAFKENDSSVVFYKFKTILRKNVVSDQTNAFNKLFNLLLCKVVDEDNNPNENDIMDFQWRNHEDNKTVLMRLSDLYKQGVDQYLNMNIADYTENELEGLIQDLGNITKANEIRNALTQLRLYNNTDFNFIEVFNENTFNKNAKIVKEIVQVLQWYELRSSNKQQFLGDFFEKLLNEGIKQEQGQYFTPIPITKFICKSLPLENIIEDKINRLSDKKQKKYGDDFLPYIIDYACGSGHFLTEIMDEINGIVALMKPDKRFTKPMKENLNFYKIPYKWAEKYVYGIEKDYRLTKTAKVNCFLNGDGDANIICGDGLDNFYKSDTYTGILKAAEPTKDNRKFEIVISNPPYSVSGFKNATEHFDLSFDSNDLITDDSSEIECVFVERTKQLLDTDGYCAIILPVSILTNDSKIARNAREILIKNFKIEAIIEFGTNTFMATGTKTITLFMRKLDDKFFKKIEECVDSFINHGNTVACNGIINPFKEYVEKVYKNIEVEDYITLIEKKPNEKIKDLDMYKEFYEEFISSKSLKDKTSKQKFKKLTDEEQSKLIYEWMIEEIIGVEREKLIYFIATYKTRVLLANTGSKKAEKNFLGYEFSNRKNYEGISINYDDDNKIICSLYNEDDLLDETKLNSYILRKFKGDCNEEINPVLNENISYSYLYEMLNFEDTSFSNAISTYNSKKKKIILKKDVHEKKLGKVCELKIGGTPSRKIKKYYENGDKLWLSIAEMNGQVVTDTKEKINDLGIKNSNVKLIKKGTTLLSFKLTLGKTAIAGKDMYTNEAIVALQINSDYFNDVRDKYLFYIFDREIIDLDEYVGKKAFGKSLNLDLIKKIKIPILKIDEQDKLINELDYIYLESDKISSDIANINQKIKELMERAFIKYKDEFVKIGSFSEMVIRGKSPKYGNGDVQVIKSGQARGYYEFDFSEKHYLKGDIELDERKLEKGDVLINSTGVGTAGRVTLFDKEGKYVVDSHITIVRVNKNRVNPDFVLYCLGTIGFKTIESMAEGQSGQIELGIDTIKSIRIPLPDKNVQDLIVSQINELRNKQKDFEDNLKIIENQKDEIIQRYLCEE